MSNGFFTFKLPNDSSTLDELSDVHRNDRIIYDVPYNPTAGFFEQSTPVQDNLARKAIVIKTPPRPAQDLIEPRVLGENCFIYFGAPFTLAKVYKFMHDAGDDDVYSWICEHNLQYRRVASIRTNWQIMIGRELKVLDTNPYMLDFDHPFEELDEQEITKYKLKKEVEQKIFWNLHDAGVHSIPKYYISWNVLIPIAYRPEPKPILLDPRKDK